MKYCFASNIEEHEFRSMAHRLKVLTYNIHKCRGLDRRVSPARIVEVLREIDADIIALQEVLSVHGKREEDQAYFLATELGFNFCLGENRRLNGGAYGNLLLSRFPLRLVQNHNITTRGREQRGCLRADIELMEATFHVFNVHLGTGFRERRQQGRALVSPEILHNRELHGPRIVLGDFNEWTHGLASRLLGAHFQNADIRAHLRRPRTYPGLLPFLRLDHIYFDPALRLERLTLHRSRTALIASDHLPLVADFRLVIPARPEHEQPLPHRELTELELGSLSKSVPSAKRTEEYSHSRGSPSTTRVR